jgi:hypothetical protein
MTDDAKGPKKTDPSQAEADFMNRLWNDDKFKQAFKADPKGTLGGLGFELPPQNVAIVVMEDNPKEQFVVIPQKPNPGQQYRKYVLLTRLKP